MITEGVLAFDLVLRDGRIAEVGIRSSRPLAVSRLFEGQGVEEVLRRVPLLFSLCGRAQAVAAAAATEAARGLGADEGLRRERERILAGECLQEYCWRLLIDLPALTGETARTSELAGLRRRIAAAEGAQRWADVAAAADELLEGAVFGLPPARWLRLRPAAFEGWIKSGATPLARLLRRLRRFGTAGGSSLLPWLCEAHLPELAARLETEAGFAARPDWRGRPSETGALARQGRHPRVVRETTRYGVTLAARLLARLVELARLPAQLRDARAVGMRRAAPRPGSGIVAVETARGTLLHWAEVTGDRVRRYRIVAPTEWNFHPRGAFVCGLAGRRVRDEGEARQAAALLAHALDPCVAYTLQVRHA